jgi:uncharacterized coiled-coil protein SlyX
MARKTKESRIRELEERLAVYEQLLTESENRENALMEKENREFEKSPAYRQMLFELDQLRAWKEAHTSDAKKLEKLHVKLDLLQKEHVELLKKTRHNARGAGRKPNDPKMQKQLEQFRNLLEEELNAREIQAEMGISRATYYRYLSKVNF